MSIQARWWVCFKWALWQRRRIATCNETGARGKKSSCCGTRLGIHGKRSDRWYQISKYPLSRGLQRPENQNLAIREEKQLWGTISDLQESEGKLELAIRQFFSKPPQPWVPKKTIPVANSKKNEGGKVFWKALKNGAKLSAWGSERTVTGHFWSKTDVTLTSTI